MAKRDDYFVTNEKDMKSILEASGLNSDIKKDLKKKEEDDNDVKGSKVKG